MRKFGFFAALLSCVSFSLAGHDYVYDGSSDTTVQFTNTGYGAAIGATSANTSIIGNGDYIGIIGYGGSGGVYGVATASYGGVGVAGQSFGSEEASNTGVSAEGSGGDYGYGVSATGYGGNFGVGVIAQGTDWAGYFNGPVYASGGFTPSDEKFKQDVRSLDKGLSTVMALKPKSYKMKKEEFKDRINLPAGNQFGFIAQDLEAVVPELVTSAKAAPTAAALKAHKKGEKLDIMQFKAVNYTGLIPILVQAIQEQQAEIDALKKSR